MLFFFHKKGSYISVATPTYFFVPIFPDYSRYFCAKSIKKVLDFLIADPRQPIDGVDLHILFYQGVVFSCNFDGFMPHEL